MTYSWFLWGDRKYCNKKATHQKLLLDGNLILIIDVRWFIPRDCGELILVNVLCEFILFIVGWPNPENAWVLTQFWLLLISVGVTQNTDLQWWCIYCWRPQSQKTLKSKYNNKSWRWCTRMFWICFCLVHGSLWPSPSTCGVGGGSYCQNKIVDPDLQGIYDF